MGFFEGSVAEAVAKANKELLIMIVSLEGDDEDSARNNTNLWIDTNVI
jgi:hypothetical protein